MSEFIQATRAEVVRPGWLLVQPGFNKKDAWRVVSVASCVADRRRELVLTHPSARKPLAQALPLDEILFRYVEDADMVTAPPSS